MEYAIHISFVHLGLQGSMNMVVTVDEVDEGFFPMGWHLSAKDLY
jgi:hypothetical protein